VDYSDSRGSLKNAKAIEREGLTFPNTDNKKRKILHQEIVPDRLDTNQEFLEQIPGGNVKLTRQQREKLIQVLRTHDSDEDDILLTLNQEQAEDLVRQNLGKVEICANINEIELAKKDDPDQIVKLYPRDFYPLIEKNKLQNSDIREVPKKNLSMVERRPIMLRKAISEAGNKGERLYTKDMLELVEDAQEKGELNAYPQEILDLMQAIGETGGDEELIDRAREIFPEEMMDLVYNQPERHKYGEDILFPEEIFEVGDQEKIQGDRVSFFTKQLLDLVNKEAEMNDKILYPKKLMKTLNDKYSNIIHLTPEQREHAVHMLSDKGSSQVVISPNSRVQLLKTLTDHKNKEIEALEEMQIDPNDQDFALNDDLLGPCVIELSPEQVLDVLNQNCMVDGIPIELNEDQSEKIGHGVPPQSILQGKDYYDASKNRLVDAEGNHICLNDLSEPEKRNFLDNLEGKRFHVVISEPKKTPRVIEEVFYDPSINSIVDMRNMGKYSQKDINTGSKLKNLKNIEKTNLKQMPSVFPNQTYYDALVDELVDKDGERHNLKDLTLREVEDLVAENDAEEVPVIIQPDGRNVVMLDNVRYLPIEDSLTDQKNRKTILTDLTPDERLSLMEALGERKGVQLNNMNSSQDEKQPIRAMFGSRQQRELDQVMERMLSNGMNSSDIPWKQNYSKGITGSPRNLEKKTVRINEKKKPVKADKRSVKSTKSKKSSKSSKSGKSKKSGKSGKSKKSKKKIPSSVESDYLNTIKSNKKKKKKPVESVLVTNLRNSSKNPLLSKLISEEDSKPSKKKKKKGNKKALSVKSSTKKTKKKPKKDKKFSSEPNNLLDKDPEEPNNEMNTFVEGGSLDEISYDADNSQNKSDSDILNEVINEVRSEEEEDPDQDKSEKDNDEDIENPHVIETDGSGFIDPDQTLGGNSDNWANYSDSQNKVEKYETFNEDQNSGESKDNLDEPMNEDTITEKTVPKISGNTFTNELLVQELESKTDQESNKQRDSFNNKENIENESFTKKSSKKQSVHYEEVNNSFDRNIENSDLRNNLNSKGSGDNLHHEESWQVEESFDVDKNIRSKKFNKMNEESFQKDLTKNDSTKFQKVYIDETGNVSGLNNSQLKNKIQKMFNEEKNKLGVEIMKRCESLIIKRSNNGKVIETEISDDEDGLLDDFHTFCRERLPSDPKYKESMMFVSMFYYFLDRRGMLKKRKLKKK
jgi:hypothetical protein